MNQVTVYCTDDKGDEYETRIPSNYLLGEMNLNYLMTLISDQIMNEQRERNNDIKVIPDSNNLYIKAKMKFTEIKSSFLNINKE